MLFFLYSKILVGAPLAVDVSGNKTGAVYSCNIDTNQCPEIQIFDGKSFELVRNRESINMNANQELLDSVFVSVKVERSPPEQRKFVSSSHSRVIPKT